MRAIKELLDKGHPVNFLPPGGLHLSKSYWVDSGDDGIVWTGPDISLRPYRFLRVYFEEITHADKGGDT